MSSAAQAQNLEPRSFSPAPTGLNFLIAGYAHIEGKLAFDPTLPIADAEFRSNTGVLAYARTLDVFGKSAKFDIILPYSEFAGEAMVAGGRRQREMSGFGDPRLRFSINFFGAPALSIKEFPGHRQDWIVGASLQVSLPLGQYDENKLINHGNNRWSFRSEIGISKTMGPWTVEVMPSVTVYTDNTDFYGGRTFAQAPLYELQGHVIYSFASGHWLSLNSTYFAGNRTTVNGVRSDNKQENSRLGLTFSMPVDRHHSIKLYASTGTSSRTGSDFEAFGMAWQYRWGGGF